MKFDLTQQPEHFRTREDEENDEHDDDGRDDENGCHDPARNWVPVHPSRKGAHSL